MDNYSLLSNNLSFNVTYSLKNIESKENAIAKDIIITGKLSSSFVLAKGEKSKKYFEFSPKGNRSPASMKMDNIGNFIIDCSKLQPNETAVFKYKMNLADANNETIINNWFIVTNKRWDVFKGLRIYGIKSIYINTNINEQNRSSTTLNPTVPISSLIINTFLISVLIALIGYVRHRNNIDKKPEIM